MGYRIHKSIGWAMQEKQFLELSGLKDLEEFEDKFSSLPLETFHVSSEKRKELFSKKSSPVIFETDLLNSYSSDMLYAFASDVDCVQSHIIFYPTAQIKEKWYRADDDIDYAFEVHCLDDTSNDFKYIKISHYPWNKYYSYNDGTTFEYKDSFEVTEALREYKIIPAIPEEIKWYLSQGNILKEKDIIKLRPLIAKWWS